MQALTDAERYPLITPEAYRFLQALRQDPYAPAWNHRCGDRLTADGLARVREFELTLGGSPAAWAPGVPPAWVHAFAERCRAHVPHYRSSATEVAGDFADIPLTSRETLSAEPWAIVPDDAVLDDLIVYDTSGRTGHPIVVPTHPIVSSMYLPLLRAALRTRGLTLDGGPERVAIVNACMQRSTFAFVSLSSFLEWAGFAKVNLNPREWKDPADRARFLDACNPEIYTGDPLSFATLATLGLASRPKALVSTSMEMPPDLRVHVEARLGCPVIDLYSLTESGPVAAANDGVYRTARHDLYVEVVGPDGRPCAPGERGEIVLTGGQNPFFPLLRYRTGDHAAMEWIGGHPALVRLEGRRATVFRDGSGGLLNGVDIAAALRPLHLGRYRLHQHADRRVVLQLEARDLDVEAGAALGQLFGPAISIEYGDLADGAPPDGHVARSTSDIPLTAEL